MTVTSVDAPPRNLYDVGPWLCERHPDLMKLCHEMGVVSNGRPDVTLIRDSVISFDEYHRDRIEYNRKNRLPEHADIDSLSITLGPQPSVRASRMLVMHPSQIAWLRLLATTAPSVYGRAVEWSVDHLALVGAGGGGLIRDWADAVARYVAGGE